MRSSTRRSSWVGEGFCGKSLEQQFSPYTYPAAGCSEVKHVLPLRRLLHGHHDRHQRSGCACTRARSWSSSSTRTAGSAARPGWPTSSCRRAPTSSATTSASARAPAATPITAHRQQLPRHRLASRSASSRLGESKSDYQIFADLSERLGLNDEYTEAARPSSTGCKKFFDKSDLPKTITWEEFDRRATTSSPLPSRLQADSVAALVPRRPGVRHSGSANPQALAPTRPRSRHLQRQDRVRVREPQGALPRRRRAPVDAAATSRAGRATRASCSASTRCDAVAAPAVHVPRPVRQTHRLARRHPGSPIMSQWLLVLAGADLTRTTRNLVVSSTTIWSSCTTTVPRCICVAVMTERVRPGVIHSYCSASKYDPLIQAIPGRPTGVAAWRR